jgi:Co/Zn/Cd efflux system component
LSSGEHHHGHSHGHGHAHEGHGHDESHEIATAAGTIILEIFEDGVPPRFRLRAVTGSALMAQASSIETVRPDGTRQLFAMQEKGGLLESRDEIPEPHAFKATVRIGEHNYPVVFEEHEHAQGSTARDNNMRAAVIHVIADAAVSVLVIAGLLLARTFGWLWMDPLAGIIGACVIASWSYGLIRDTGGILLDMNPDRGMSNKLRETIEMDGDELADLHLWRLGPGHLGAIVSVITAQGRDADYYRNRLAHFKSLSHLTVEVARKS